MPLRQVHHRPDLGNVGGTPPLKTWSCWRGRRFTASADTFFPASRVLQLLRLSMLAAQVLGGLAPVTQKTRAGKSTRQRVTIRAWRSITSAFKFNPSFWQTSLRPSGAVYTFVDDFETLCSKLWRKVFRRGHAAPTVAREVAIGQHVGLEKDGA